MWDLKEYKEKRDFSQTPEPPPSSRKDKAQRFCIQKHRASRLHYDLRIEHKGVLLSWAVPKGPSGDPEEKRLAIMTETHPLSYLNFEGTIPKGNYGAGKMIVWDIGNYALTGELKTLSAMLEKGHLKLNFAGRKMRSVYHLIRMGHEKNQWLLYPDKKIKGEFPYREESVFTGREVNSLERGENIIAKAMAEAQQGDFPEPFRPMLAELSRSSFSRKNWIYEIKYDGYRAILFKKDGRVSLISRNGNNLNKDYPEIVESAKKIYPDCVIDGEIIIANESGGGDFQGLQQLKGTKNRGKLRFIGFDLVYVGGYTLSDLPLELRKGVLEKLLAPLKESGIRYSRHIEQQGNAYFKAAGEMGLEGIIAKKKSSPYLRGKRSSNWQKFKHQGEAILPVLGLTESSDVKRPFGALLLGREENGNKMQFAGKVGTGFSDKNMKEILNTLKAHRREERWFKIPDRVKFWVNPEIKARVRFTQETSDGKLRHPVLMEIIKDKNAGAEKEVITKSAKIANNNTDVKRTNQSKVLFPDSGTTKADVMAYYEKISDFILPVLKDRPLTLKRQPDGLLSEGFYQKNVEGDVPAFIRTVEIESKSSKRTITYAMCNNLKSLLFLVNWGCFEFHPMNSRRDQLDSPDHIVFDIDPQGNNLEELRQATRTLTQMLESWSIPYSMKTSGSRGIHVFVPLRLGYTHDQAKQMAHIIAKKWHAELPHLTSLERDPAKRMNKIYLDYLQNGRSKTLASAYSLRVRPGSPVSMPVTMDELENLKSLRQFTMFNVPELLEKRKQNWQDIYRRRIKLETIMAAIEKHTST